MNPYADADIERVADAIARAFGHASLDDAFSAHESEGLKAQCAASAALAALAATGQLRPAGDGKTKTEHEIDWRHRDREQDNPTMTYEDFTEQQVDQGIASADSLGYEPRQVRRRFITTWPDGATFTGAWETR